MADYRKPTMKESEKLEKSRSLMVQGIEGEKDFLSKLSTTAAKAARDDMRMARSLRESVPARAREGEAYDLAGYKKGGKVKKYAEGGKAEDDMNPYVKGALAGGLGSTRKPLPSETIKENKRAKSFNEGVRDVLLGTATSGPAGGAMAAAKKMGSSEFKSGGKVGSASKRADGCAIRGKTRA
jgi:hypothetical protein